MHCSKTATSVYTLTFLFFILWSFSSHQKSSKTLPLPINSNWSDCPPLSKTAFCLTSSWPSTFGGHPYDPQLHSSRRLCSFLWSLGSWQAEPVSSALPTHSKHTCNASVSSPTPLPPGMHPFSLGEKYFFKPLMGKYVEIVTPSRFNFNFVKYCISDSYFKVLSSQAEEKGSAYLELWRCTMPAKLQALRLLAPSEDQSRYMLVTAASSSSLLQVTDLTELSYTSNTNPRKHPTDKERERTRTVWFDVAWVVHLRVCCGSSLMG